MEIFNGTGGAEAPEKPQRAGEGGARGAPPEPDGGSGGLRACEWIAAATRGAARGRPPGANVINLKQPLNDRQNVWKYQKGEGKSDSDGREKDVG